MNFPNCLNFTPSCVILRMTRTAKRLNRYNLAVFEQQIMQAIRRAIDEGAKKCGSREALAQSLGLHYNTLSSWYNGRVMRADLTVLVNLFGLAGMSLDELRGETRTEDAQAKLDEVLARISSLERTVLESREGVSEPPVLSKEAMQALAEATHLGRAAVIETVEKIVRAERERGLGQG